MFALTTMLVLKLLVLVAGILLAGPVGRYWRRVGNRHPHIDGDRIVLRFPRNYVVLAHGCAIAMAGFAVYLFGVFRNVTSPAHVPVFLVVSMWGLAAVLLACAVFVWLSLRVRLELDAHAVRGRTICRGFRTIPWGDIARVRYSTRFKSLTIADAAGQRVVAYPFMPGFALLLEQLRLRVPAEIREPAASHAAVDPLK